MIFVVPSLVAMVPVIGWVLAPLVALLINGMELFFAISDPLGLRYGDRMAGTQVISIS